MTKLLLLYSKREVIDTSAVDIFRHKVKKFRQESKLEQRNYFSTEIRQNSDQHKSLKSVIFAIKYSHTHEIKQQYNILKMKLLRNLGCLENEMEPGVLPFNIQ